MTKKIITALILFLAIAVCGMWLYSAWLDIQERNAVVVSGGKAFESEAYKDTIGDDIVLPDTKTVAYYCILITEPADTIGKEAIMILESNQIAYETDTSPFDPIKRTYDGIQVMGCYEDTIKEQVFQAISAGETFYIAVGEQDSRDHFTRINTEAMCKILYRYQALGFIQPISEKPADN